MRVNKYIASCGICSRRDADKLIQEGRVCVNGSTDIMGLQVTGEEDIRVDGNPVKSVDNKVVIAFNKPVGVTVSERDEHAKVLVSDLIDYPVRLTYAGRLDKDSEGLLLLTNDGDFIDKAMKAINHHEKEYVVTLNKPVLDSDINKLSKGIFLKELEVKTRPCVIKRMGDKQVNMVLTQGLNRQIRRMWSAVGYEVKTLKRIRVINIKLGNLEVSKWREITGAELEELYKQVGM